MKKSKNIKTQIAPTPILSGDSAIKLINYLNINPNKDTDNGIKNLYSMFKGKEK